MLLIVQVALVLVVAYALVLVIQRPRLSVDVSLRGGTRHGTLYVVLHNRGRTRARHARVEIALKGDTGERSQTLARDIGELAAGDVVRVEVDGLQGLLPEVAHPSAIVVTARARIVLPARATLAIEPKQRESATAPETVRYERAGAIPCPGSTDGRHAFERRPYVNDGVTEQWDVCGRCRHVRRQPLTPGEQATQTRVRAARMEQERRKMEAEFARNAQREDPEPRRARREPAGEGDTLPVEVAFYILELDSRSATWTDVLAAHRRLALANHPDRRAGAEQKMQEVNRARDRLREHFGLRTPIE